MPAAVEAIALFAPTVVSNAVFSTRRATKGIDNMGDNPFYGAMNLDIAAGQTLKGGRAAKALAELSEADTNILTNGASEAIKDASKTNKVLKGASKIINFTADHINPIICATSGIKVLGSDDKTDTAIREGLALTTMFAGEAAAKKVLGLPKTVVEGGTKTQKKFLGITYNTIEGGEKVTIKQDGLYKKIKFLDKIATATNNYCGKKKLFGKIPLQIIPKAIPGAIFAGTSIATYKVGETLANFILGDKKSAA
jgi:hypothetical protein